MPEAMHCLLQRIHCLLDVFLRVIGTQTETDGALDGLPGKAHGAKHVGATRLGMRGAGRSRRNIDALLFQRMQNHFTARPQERDIENTADRIMIRRIDPHIRNFIKDPPAQIVPPYTMRPCPWAREFYGH